MFSYNHYQPTVKYAGLESTCFGLDWPQSYDLKHE